MLILCTNSWSHHMGPLCRELSKALNGEFRMLISRPLTHPDSVARMKNGWIITPPKESWIIGPPKSDVAWFTGPYNDLILRSEVAIIGAVSIGAAGTIQKRVRQGKLTFFMGERIFKKPRLWTDYLNPRRIASWIRMHICYSHLNVHYLTMGHGCVEDLRFLHACRGRIWRWGYLAQVSSSPVEKSPHEKIRIGWCGRLIWWKKVDYILHAFARLPAQIRDCAEIQIVGSGAEESRLKGLCKQLCLDEFVTFTPFMRADDIRRWMQDLDVYVFPSNRMEGWGVALGEAMDSTCAVIANKEAGSTLELVVDGVNGFTFEDGDITKLCMRLRQLIENAVLRRELGLSAWRTMQNWSPAEGAKRLLSLIEQVSRNEPPRMSDGGLCSLRR